MKNLKPIISLFVVAAIGFGIYYLLFPPPEKVIRKRLDKLAAAISARPEGNIGKIANVDRIGSFFHPNVSITVEGFGREYASIQGLGELKQAAFAARQQVSGVSVQFYNLDVTVGPTETNATVLATALIKVGDETNPAVQELSFSFEKLDRDWLIRSATPSKARTPP